MPLLDYSKRLVFSAVTEFLLNFTNNHIITPNSESGS